MVLLMPKNRKYLGTNLRTWAADHSAGSNMKKQLDADVGGGDDLFESAWSFSIATNRMTQQSGYRLLARY